MIFESSNPRERERERENFELEIVRKWGNSNSWNTNSLDLGINLKIYKLGKFSQPPP